MQDPENWFEQITGAEEQPLTIGQIGMVAAFAICLLAGQVIEYMVNS